MDRELGVYAALVWAGCLLSCAVSAARQPEVRASAETNHRYAAALLGEAARLESSGLSLDIAGTARLRMGDHEASLRATSIGRVDARVSLAEVEAVIVGVELRAARAPGVVEWWRELPSGLEHGVTIADRPPGSAPLEVELEVRGVGTRTAGDAIELVHESEVVARYAHLTVLDADGARVPARMRASADGIAIEIDDAEASYPVVIDPLLIGVQEATLVAPDGTANDWLGGSVALTSSGDRALVGAHQDDTAGVDAGSARVFVRTGTTWAEEATLSAPDGAANDWFGWSVALTSSGDRALVGAYQDDTARGVDAGSARVFVRTGTTWAQEATLVAPDGAADDSLGFSVALTSSGDRALVGAYEDDILGGGNAGSARVFVRTGTTWAQEATLVAPDGAAGDYFGRSVALTSSGDRALVGAYEDDTARGANRGSARVFVRTGTTWAEEATLVAPDGAADEWFGHSVTLTSSGDRALVGVPRDGTARGFDVGSARVFVRTGTTWAQEATLVAPDGAAFEFFGWSVALTSSGDRALGGAHLDDTAGVDAGSARVFVRTGTTWAEEATLSAPDGAANDSFGWSVALTSSGDRALAGAYGDDTGGGSNAGSARVFTFRPADANGTACTTGDTCLSGFCADGVCCDTACGGGSATDCQACSVALTGGPAGNCAVLAPAVAPTVICRASSGDCDAPEVCTTSSTTCPADASALSGTVCRPPAGACDAAEVCDGAGFTCPTDARVPAGTVCRPDGGSCDQPEVCDGVGVTCPGDTFEPAGSLCGVGVGDCALPSSCTGISPMCPATAGVRPAGTLCRPSIGECDLDDHCDGTSAACVEGFAPSTTTCGPPAAGGCDASDHCDGTSADCVETFVVDVECRAAAGPCDTAERCVGDSPSCPSDDLRSVGVTCREATDPSCDTAEVCDGTAAACPADVTSCVATDGGARDGGSAGADVGGVDAGSPPIARTGCGCSVGTTSASPGAVALLALLGSRRRRTSRTERL